MVWPNNIDSGRSNSQLGDRSRCCRHCNLVHLLSIHSLKHAANSSTVQGSGKRRGEGIGEITTKQKPSGVFAGRDNAKFTAMFALPPKADIAERGQDVRLVPKADMDGSAV
jgi:hypothetical protein